VRVMEAVLKALKEVKASVQKRGLWATLRVLGSEVLFDWRWGTDTFSLVDSRDLDGFPDELKKFTAGYQGANSLLFHRAMSVAEGVRGKSFKDQVFVDYGCGKGRALFMAANLGFKKVIGVELSDSLCRIAERNAEIYASKRRSLPPIEVVQSDATQFEAPADTTLFFFFNPFRGEILAEVLKKAVPSAKKDAIFVYLNPTEPEAFEKVGLVARGKVQLSSANIDALVYSL
jgi:SAM-dependent methyltransferase